MYEVAKHLPLDVEEIAKYSSVSNSWRRSAALYHHKSLTPCAPLLIFIHAKTENDQQGIRSVYSVSSKRVFNIKLLQARGRRCCGTPFGWVLTIGLDLNINLLNPFSLAQIPLPPQLTFEDQPEEPGQIFVHRIALSSNPSAPNSNTPIVLVAYGDLSCLAMATPADKTWTSFQGSFSYEISDIIFLNGRFYVVHYCGLVGICDLTTTTPSATYFAPSPEELDSANQFYLVEISGHLHIVGQVWKSKEQIEVKASDRKQNEVEVRDDPNLYIGKTKYFRVLKLDLHEKEWTEVKDLGSHALFVGNNQSFAISTTDHTEFRGNCIYFTEYYYDKDGKSVSDMGIYDFAKDMVEPIYVTGDQISASSLPFFFMPTP